MSGPQLFAVLSLTAFTFFATFVAGGRYATVHANLTPRLDKLCAEGNQYACEFSIGCIK